jgi:hypothetical protein
MTWQIWDEHRDHGHVRAGSLRRRWAACVQVEHTAWPRATRAGRGLLLALGGVWGLHGQEGRAAQRRDACVDAGPAPALSPGGSARAPQLVRCCARGGHRSAAALDRAWTPSLARPPQA